LSRGRNPLRPALYLGTAALAGALLSAASPVLSSADPAMTTPAAAPPSQAENTPPGTPSIPGARLEARPYQDIPGWDRDDHATSYRVFLRTCARIATESPELRPARASPPQLARACRAALAAGSLDGIAARAFFERWFEPLSIDPEGGGAGFLTGYYEPEIPGALAPDPGHPVPVLGRAADLVSLTPGMAKGDLPPGLSAARQTGAGLEPYPDRAAIWDGALDGRGLEIAWLPDRVELFMAQVQGSARVRLPDGPTLRLVYAGRNGLPYTSIGKVIVAEGHMALEEMTLAKLKAWLRAHPVDAERIMRMNRSYIFFARGEGLDPAEGPIGAASVPLTPLRSIAVDRTLWSYGLPFWIAADLPLAGEGSSEPLARLMIAQDTGSAILGPARADLFMGSGDEAGDLAGLIRHPGRFTVLWPRPEPLP
jgi:membrane-bound lytic murein transglycosylase A